MDFLSEDPKRGLYALASVRMIIGFMLLWAFFDKMFGLGMRTQPGMGMIDGGSPTAYYLAYEAHGIFEGIWNALAGNAVVDILLMFGLLAVGLGMILGIASRLSTIGIVIMMVLMYSLSVPPLDNPLFDYHVVYALVSLAVLWFGGYKVLSLRLKWDGLPVIRDHPILQ